MGDDSNSRSDFAGIHRGPVSSLRVQDVVPY